MRKLLLKFFLLMSALISSFEISAKPPPEFKKYFEGEQYQEALESLKSVDDKVLALGEKNYLTGLCFSRLREFSEAINFYKKAVKENDSIIELHYEYGQALYANNNLKLARYEFSKSAGRNYNFTTSIYYAAYISELLEDVVMAKSYYRKLIKDPKTDKKFLQISLFQYSKILLKMMRKEEESLKNVERSLIRLDINLTNHIPQYIFPLLKKALETDLTSELAVEIEQFSHQLHEEFKLGANNLTNGRVISPERFNLSLAQRLKYDDNVVITNYPSAINESEIFSKYDFIVKRKMIISPELRLTYTKHKDQQNADVYKNDALSISSAVRNKVEYSFMGKPASFLMDLEYASIHKDWEIAHRLKYFSKSYTFYMGEQLSISPIGDSFFKVRYSNYKDETTTSNYSTVGGSLDQYVLLKEGQQLVIASLDLSRLDYENELLSNTTYLARVIYLIFEFVPSYTLQLLLSESITDTKALKETKGYETNLNTGIEISKAFTDKIKLSVNYYFTQNTSKQIESKYHKQVAGTELSYTF